MLSEYLVLSLLLEFALGDPRLLPLLPELGVLLAKALQLRLVLLSNKCRSLIMITITSTITITILLTTPIMIVATTTFGGQGYIYPTSLV